MAEKKSKDTIERFHIFIDTNLLYTKKIDYNIFDSYIFKNLIEIRHNYNLFYIKAKKNFILIFPDIVIRERYAQKEDSLRIELNAFLKKIENLDEPNLKMELQKVINNIPQNIKDKGNEFISTNEIKVIPPCSENYFNNIIEKAINKKLPFKPQFDKNTERFTGDNGFKDALIWYSIIDYVKNFVQKENDRVVLLTNNAADFKSPETLEEFKKYSNKDINIFSLKDNIIPSDFFDLILKESKNKTLDKIDISYILMGNKVSIKSVKVSPLEIDISPWFSEELDSIGFENFVTKKLKEKLSGLGFNIDKVNIKFNELILTSVSINLRNFKDYFLDILDIEMNYEGNILYTEYPDYPNIEIGTDLKCEENWLKNNIASFLEKKGYGDIDPDMIDCEVVEYIPDND